MPDPMPSDPNPTIRDKYGMTWNVHGPTARGTFTAALQQPAYGTPPGDEVVSATKWEDLIPEVNAYADAFITSGGKPPARGNTTVTAAKPGATSGMGLVLLLLVLWAADNRK